MHHPVLGLCCFFFNFKSPSWFGSGSQLLKMNVLSSNQFLRRIVLVSCLSCWFWCRELFTSTKKKNQPYFFSRKVLWNTSWFIRVEWSYKKTGYHGCGGGIPSRGNYEFVKRPKRLKETKSTENSPRHAVRPLYRGWTESHLRYYPP